MKKSSSLLALLFLLSGCGYSISENIEKSQEPTASTIIWEERAIPQLGIELSVLSDATIKITRVGRDQSPYLEASGAIVDFMAKNEAENVAFIIRKMKRETNIDSYIHNIPSRDSMKTIKEDCHINPMVTEADETSIYKISKCSFGGFVPIYAIQTPENFFDINIEDSGRSQNWELLKQSVLSIHRLQLKQ